jgi:hypothetical protein
MQKTSATGEQFLQSVSPARFACEQASTFEAELRQWQEIANFRATTGGSGSKQAAAR